MSIHIKGKKTHKLTYEGNKKDLFQSIDIVKYKVHNDDWNLSQFYRTIWQPASFRPLSTKLVWYSDPQGITTLNQNIFYACRRALVVPVAVVGSHCTSS